jgi:phytol kinase
LALDWPEQPAVVAAGVLVMALGDGLAGFIGPLVRSPSWSVMGQRKSVVCTGTMAAGSLGALLLVQHLAQVQGLPCPALPALLATAAIATALEQVALLGIDNLTVPITTGWLWQLWSSGS